LKPWQSLFNGRVLAFNGVIDIETRAKAKALGIVARTGKNFTGLEVQGNEKIYFKHKSIELSRVEVDNGTFAELADIFTNTPLAFSIYKRGIRVGSISIPEIDRDYDELVARLINLIRFIQMSLPRYYQPVVMHVGSDGRTNGGLYLNRFKVADADEYSLTEGLPLLLFSRGFSECRIITDIFMMDGKFALYKNVPYILTARNVLFTIDSTGKIRDVELTMVSNKEFIRMFRYI